MKRPLHVRRDRRLAASFLFLCFSLPLGAQESRPSTRHDDAFWRSIVQNGKQVPAGENAFDLICELESYFSSPDPERRDAWAYEIPSHWIYRGKKISHDDMRTLMRRWTPLLLVKIGEKDTDSVLLRSFAALNLSTLAAVDNEIRFLSIADRKDLLDAAITYLEREKDVRGYIEPKGWHHSVAHTADLLKFLARSKDLDADAQMRILNALIEKNFSAAASLAHGEDERMAAAVLSLARRDDFAVDAAKKAIVAIPARFSGLWRSSPFDFALFVALQNVKRFLRALHVALDDEPGDNEEAHAFRAAIGAALKKF